MHFNSSSIDDSLLAVLLQNNNTNLFSDDIIISVTSKLAPEKKIIKLDLPHRPPDHDICIFVKDLRLTEYEKTCQFWKNRCATEIKKNGYVHSLPSSISFIPLCELKVAYQTYSSKRKLASTFDVFIADERIVHLLPNKLGKSFYNGSAWKHPIYTDLKSPNWINNLNKSFLSTQFVIRGNGTFASCWVGHTNMQNLHIKDNIISVVSGLFDKWPGGIANIRSVYVGSKSNSIPLYFNSSSASAELVSQIYGSRLYTKLNKSTINSKRVKVNLPFLIKEDLNRIAKLVKNPKVRHPDKPLAEKRINVVELLNQVSDDLPISKEKLKSIVSYSKNFSKKKLTKVKSKRKLKK